MAKKSCKKGYYYCNTDKKCKKIPKGWHVMPATGYLMRDSEHKDENKEETNGKKKNGNGSNGNGNGNGGSDGGSNGGGVSEAWSAKYKKSIDCDNPKGFSQRAHCQGRKKVNEQNNDFLHAGNPNPQMRNMPIGTRNAEKLANAYGPHIKNQLIHGLHSLHKARESAKRTKLMKSDSVRVAEAKEKGDHEVSMAQSQLKKSEENIRKLRKALGTKEKNIPAWVQAKITDTEHNTDAAAGYMDEGKRDGKSAKDKDYSLRDWFKGGGWVQAGGKYDGKPCARQPGQKTKPFCRDADDRASMSKKERSRRAAKKRREDSNPNKEGKAKMVSASYSNWRADLEDLHEIPAIVAVPLVAGGAYAAYKGLKHLKKKGDEALDNARQNATLNNNPFGAGARQRAIEKAAGAKPGTLNPNMQRLRNSYEPQGDMIDEGKKDACYHKVKSRYKIWPSAYASGALVKCRKVGAKNWGNSKKESFSNWREDMLLEGLEDKLRGMSASQIEDLIKANKGAEEKIRATLAKMRSATPNPQGKGAQLPNVPKRTETYQRGGSDRVSYQRRQTVTRADVQGGTEAAKRAASGQGRYKPGVGVTSDFKLDPKFKPPGSRGMRGGVRPRGRGGKIGLAVTAAGLAAPFVVGAIKRAFNKEDYDYSNWRDNFQATEYETVDIIKPEPLVVNEYKEGDKIEYSPETEKLIRDANKTDFQKKTEKLGRSAKQTGNSIELKAPRNPLTLPSLTTEEKKCWKGYKKAGTQKLFGKTYNRCVKAHFSDWRAEMDLHEKKAKKDYDGDGKIESGEEEYKGSRDRAIKKAIAMREDWQKSNRKDGVDGMSQKSVNAYKRENPGSKLQTAVTEKKPKGKRAKRRKSFCARSKGQKDMHNIDCSKTPEKKICKARKRWRC